MPEVKGITVTINGVTKTVAKMSITQNGITKEAVFGYEIKFDTNITTAGSQYYVANQSVSVITPNSRFVASGSALGALPSISNVTYVLSGITYTIYVEGWYTTKACTTQVTAATVPTGNATYYAKWKMTANKTIQNATFTCPKFINSAYAYGRGSNGARSQDSVSAGSSRGCIGFIIMTPPGSGSAFEKSYSGIAGSSISISSLSVTVAGETLNAYNGVNSTSWKHSGYNLLSVSTDTARTLEVTVGGSTFVVLSWPALPSRGSTYYRNITATWYLNASTSLGSKVIGRFDNVYDKETGWGMPSIDNAGYDNWYANYGNAAYGCTSIRNSSNHTLTVPAAGGGGAVTGYITLYA